MGEDINTTDLATIDVEALKRDLQAETKDILALAVKERDSTKLKELTDKYNANQTIKTMLRKDKMGDLLDTITDQAIERFKKRPGEISNQEMLQGLKVIADITDREQKQLSGGLTQQPLIQVTNTTNTVNVEDGELNRESRERVKNAIEMLLASSKVPTETQDEVNSIVSMPESDFEIVEEDE